MDENKIKNREKRAKIIQNENNSNNIPNNIENNISINTSNDISNNNSNNLVNENNVNNNTVNNNLVSDNASNNVIENKQKLKRVGTNDKIEFGMLEDLCKEFEDENRKKEEELLRKKQEKEKLKEMKKQEENNKSSEIVNNNSNISDSNQVNQATKKPPRIKKLFEKVLGKNKFQKEKEPGRFQELINNLLAHCKTIKFININTDGINKILIKKG